MRELDWEESWVPKNWCFWTVVLEKTLESPLDCKEIQQVLPKGDQSWVFIGNTDAEAETPILWPPHAKSWLIGKHPDSGRDWGQEKKGMTECEMAGWHHRLDTHEFEWSLRVSDGQGGLACCDSWGCKELDTTEELIWTEGYTCVCMLNRSVMSDSLKCHELEPVRLLFPWNSPDKNTGVGCHSLLQGIKPRDQTQGSNPGLHCRCILYSEPPRTLSLKIVSLPPPSCFNFSLDNECHQTINLNIWDI